MDPAFQQLGTSLLLGLLVGLQRERATPTLAGLRTFPLISVLGTVSALLAAQWGGWIVVAGMLGIAVVVLVHHLSPVRQPDANHGSTTDVAMLLMFAVGALTVVGPISVAVAVGGGVAVLLQFKPELHGFAAKLGDDDLKAVMQFVLITCIILPVLPRGNLELFSPPHDSLNVLNPFEIWLMVVLVVGLSLGGYILYKFLGREAGTLLGGVLGGAISSTATTVSYARQAWGDPSMRQTAAIVIMIASTVSFLRVLTAVAVVSRGFFLHVLPPVSLLMVLTLLPAAVLWFRRPHEDGPMPVPKNPTQLKSAVVFGAMYGLVLLALAAAKLFAGGQGLYVVAGLSGLTEMDAITLSTARLAETDRTVAAEGWRLIVLALMANMAAKTVLGGLLGGWRLLGRLALLFLLPLAGGAALLAWAW
jgi:uncharacterized membrane protein (DUF4010 family)